MLRISAIPASLISGLMLGVLHPDADAGYGVTFGAVVAIAVLAALLAMTLRNGDRSAPTAEKCQTER